jgi:dTDP-4-amino-4,6-dideoxygalactose transaminase
MGIGEGGLFVSADRALAESVRRLANFGFVAYVVNSVQGANAKLSEYAAAVGLAQLERWPRLLERRLAVFAQYRQALAQLPQVRMQAQTQWPPATLSVQLPQQAPAVASALAEAGIETRRWYLPPLYRHPAFGHLRRIGPAGGERLPVTESLDETLLGLPFHTRLSSDDVAAVVRVLAARLAQPGAGSLSER